MLETIATREFSLTYITISVVCDTSLDAFVPVAQIVAIFGTAKQKLELMDYLDCEIRFRHLSVVERMLNIARRYGRKTGVFKGTTPLHSNDEIDLELLQSSRVKLEILRDKRDYFRELLA